MPGGWEWLIIIGVLVLLFGAKRLPEMARSVGQSARVFKGEMKGLRDDEGRGAPQQPQSRAAELPPVNEQDTGPVNGAGTTQPSEPVRRDADR
jgi:sec-independent protein translocase protein TatA